MKPGNLIVYPSGYNEKGANSCGEFREMRIFFITLKNQNRNDKALVKLFTGAFLMKNNANVNRRKKFPKIIKAKIGGF